MEEITMKLIFIHGSGGSKESWHYQTQYFTGSEAIDLPGHPEGELRPSIDEYVEWLRGYITEKGYSDVVLAGHSLGGGIALLYALKYPEDMKGLITLGSGARLRVHPMYLEALEKAIANPAQPGMANNQAYDRVAPELAEVLKRRAEENGPKATLNDMRACDRFDIMGQIGEIKVPTLAVCGDEDVMTPAKYSNYLAEHMPKARAVVIPGGTHFVFAEKPEEVNRAIEDFLKEI